MPEESPSTNPDWREIVRRNFEAGRLHFTTDLASCLDRVEVVFGRRDSPRWRTARPICGRSSKWLAPSDATSAATRCS